MKRWFLLSIAAGVISCTGNVATNGVTRPQSTGTALYILPSQQFSPGDMAQALDKVLADANGGDNLIVYVHGRSGGKTAEPTKSLKRVMPELTDEYTARVVMFYWPGSSEGGKAGFPEDRARAAAPGLLTALKNLQEYKNSNAAKLKDVEMTLILHSMGNIVFEEFLRSYKPGTLNKTLFDTVVLSSSASASKEHAAWLKSMDFSPNIYVTVNGDDKVLIGAGITEHAARLGKELKAGDSLAPNATYVDVTEAGVNHAYFLPSHQEDSKCLENFYDSVMNGKAFRFDTSGCVKSGEHRNGTVVYQLKSD